MSMHLYNVCEKGDNIICATESSRKCARNSAQMHVALLKSWHALITNVGISYRNTRVLLTYRSMLAYMYVSSCACLRHFITNVGVCTCTCTNM